MSKRKRRRRRKRRGMSKTVYANLDQPLQLFNSIEAALRYHPDTTGKDWHKFDSEMEAQRYQHLWACQQEGQIGDLKAHPATFVINDRITLKPNAIRPKTRYKQKRVYTPDFFYIYQGVSVYEDFKGSKRQKGYARASLAHSFFIASLLEHMPSEAFHFKVVTNIHADPSEE